MAPQSGSLRDRGDKFNDYQTLESLQEYVLVNSKHQRVEIFRRDQQNRWFYCSYTEEIVLLAPLLIILITLKDNGRTTNPSLSNPH